MKTQQGNTVTEAEKEKKRNALSGFALTKHMRQNTVTEAEKAKKRNALSGFALTKHKRQNASDSKCLIGCRERTKQTERQC